MVNGFSRMVLPLTLQMKLCNSSDNVLEIASSVGGVKSSGVPTFARLKLSKFFTTEVISKIMYMRTILRQTQN